MSKKSNSISRRRFLSAAAATTASIGALGFTSNASASKGEWREHEHSKHKRPKGPVTLYFEFRIAPPENAGLLSDVDEKALELSSTAGFLNIALKQTVGDSTMTKNYPPTYKGVLANSYADAAAAGTLPLFYGLFIRFDSFKALKKSKVDKWFDNTIVPRLFAYKPGVGKTNLAFDFYEGVFQTVTAGNRFGIYDTKQTITEYLMNQQDAPDNDFVTVLNHVSIHDNDVAEFESKVVGLLGVAQNTFQPSDDPAGNGLPGSFDNSNYRRAVTTEIMRNAFPTGDARTYLMQGVFESIFDHENSHLDPRFKQASMPVGVYIIAGPVEPFYKTRKLLNAS